MSEFRDLWHYDQIAVEEVERAARLRAAPEWAELIDMTSHALRASLGNGVARFGFDESGCNASDLRAVVQFPIGEQLFDWFFNAQTGYRAQFRRGSEYGNAQNLRLVTMLRRELETCNLLDLSTRRLSSTFDDRGPMTATVQDVLSSLDPLLSKVWFCERLISRDSGVKDLSVFRSTPDLTFRSETPAWRSVRADEPNAWLDVKGAFVSGTGPYQLKEPAVRAQSLQCRGTA